VSATRDIELGNLFNVRDLGGHLTAGGRHVRWGRVYRAASLHQLDPEHVDDWNRLGLRTLVDLRRRREREAGGWPSFLDSARVCSLPMIPDDWTLAKSSFATPLLHICEAYDQMRRLGGEAVRSTFELLADPDSYPLMFFCIAGKDRTGIMAAVLLSSLGVADDAVLDDFELSGDRVMALVDHLRARGGLDDNPMINQPEEILRAPRAAMASALTRLREDHGSVEGYLTWCGVTDEVLDAVRVNLLA